MQTNDYKLFKIVDLNRTIQTWHIEKIKKSIQKVWYLKYNPIIVNDKYEIIDGQHRFMACVSLNLPIEYVIENGDIDEVMVQLNSTQKEWTLTDFIDFYASKWVEWFVYFNNFKEKYKLNQTWTIAILTGSSSGTWKKIKNWTGFERLDYAETIADIMLEFAELLDFAKSRTFIRGLIKVYSKGGKKELKRLLNKALIIRRQVNVADYCIAFENILNKWRDPKNFISL